MSESSRKVGLASGRGLIEHADQSYCQSSATNVLGWTTEDLADFVQGLLEAGIRSLSQLRPENVKHFHERNTTHEFIDLTRPT